MLSSAEGNDAQAAPKGHHMSYSLINIDTNETIRAATAAEYAASLEAAEQDGGAGAIEVAGTTCYVIED